MDVADTTPRRFRLPPPRVEVRHTGTARGMGVFALELFEPGAIVEVCPVLLFRENVEALPGSFSAQGVQRPRTYALALGYGSMYNSANPANMSFRALRVTQNPLIEFSAVRVVGMGEELTINYSGFAGACESPDDAWFARMGVEKL